jgi:hypothetical protein
VPLFSSGSRLHHWLPTPLVPTLDACPFGTKFLAPTPPQVAMFSAEGSLPGCAIRRIC